MIGSSSASFRLRESRVRHSGERGLDIGIVREVTIGHGGSLTSRASSEGWRLRDHADHVRLMDPVRVGLDARGTDK